MISKGMLGLGTILLTVAAAFVLPIRAQQGGNANAPSIEGSYLLVSRDAPRDSTARDLDVRGMMTYTAKYRNFNITWVSPEGKHTSVAYLCEYSLTGDTYRENPLYWMMYDESQGAPDYNVPEDKTIGSPVTWSDGKPSFKLNGEGVTLTFDGPNVTAVSDQGFTDHWVKVE